LDAAGLQEPALIKTEVEITAEVLTEGTAKAARSELATD